MNQDLVELKMRILEAVAEGDNVLARAELGAAADLAHAAGQPSTELLLTGVNSYLNGEYAAAGATLEEALRLAPDDPDILDFLGNVESALGLTWASCDEIAESRYTRAIVMRIKVARDQADGAGTEKAARQARNLFEENWRSYYFIGRNLNLVGRHVEAVNALRESQGLRPASAALTELGIALEHTSPPDFEQAKQCYRDAVKLNPRCSAALFNLAVAAVRDGDLDAAVRSFEEATRLFEAAGDAEGTRIIENHLSLLAAQQSARRNRDEKGAQRLWAFEVVVSAVETLHLLEMAEIRQAQLGKFTVAAGRAVPDSFWVLKRWNSYSPMLPRPGTGHTGGGYFLSWRGHGVVIDPGVDFVRNMYDCGLVLGDIDAIVLTHAHADHTHDLERLVTLVHQYHEKLAKTVDVYVTLGVAAKFASWLSQIKRGNLGRVEMLNPGHPLALSDHLTLVPVATDHPDLMTETHSAGLLLDLEGDGVHYNVGITGDTKWTAEIQNRFMPATDLLVVHVGTILPTELDTVGHPLGQAVHEHHLGLRGVFELLCRIRPTIGVVSEFGEEHDVSRPHIDKALSFALRGTTVLTGDVGLEIRMGRSERWLRVVCSKCHDLIDPVDVVSVSTGGAEDSSLRYVHTKCVG